MIQCPECRQMLPEDSAFCDKCGKELKWCPVCRRPKRGTECPVCGNDLIAGRKYLAMVASGTDMRPVQQTVSPIQSVPPKQSAPSIQPVPQGTAVAKPQPTVLVGSGLRLTLAEGAFGRVGGMWPQLASCTYVSSNHGVIGRTAAGWTITDNGTTNGTYVNDQRLAPGSPAVLALGSRVRIATLDFVVE